MIQLIKASNLIFFLVINRFESSLYPTSYFDDKNSKYSGILAINILRFCLNNLCIKY